MAKTNAWRKNAAKKKARRKFHESDANLRRFLASYQGDE